MSVSITPAACALVLTGPAPLIVQGYGLAAPTPLATTLRNLFPAQRVKVLNDDNTLTNEWYRALRLISDLLIGGVPQADLLAAVNNSSANVVRISELSAAIERQARNNAASIAAAVSVLQTAEVPGAAAIPPVQVWIGDSSQNGGE